MRISLYISIYRERVREIYACVAIYVDIVYSTPIAIDLEATIQFEVEWLVFRPCHLVRKLPLSFLYGQKIVSFQVFNTRPNQQTHGVGAEKKPIKGKKT